MTIYELADLLDARLIITRYPNQEGRYSAHFDNYEVMERGLLGSPNGNGKTPEDAVDDYYKQIYGRRIVFFAMSPTMRREFNVPKGK